MNHTCRGTISLHGALIHTVDPLTFVVSNGGTQTFHIKASTENERQQWVIALELAKAKAIQAIESGKFFFNIPKYYLLFFTNYKYVWKEEEEDYQEDNQKGDETCTIKDLN